MSISKIVIILILLQFLFVGNLFSKEIRLIEGTNSKVVSSVFLLQQKDSSLYISYDSIKKLFIKRSYPEALNKAQILLKKSKEENNIDLEFLSSYLIGEIFDKTNKLENALKYYNISKKIKDSYIKNESLDESFLDISYAKVLFKLGSTFHKLEQLDSAKVYYDKLEKLNSFNEEVLRLQAMSYSNVSGIFEGDSLFAEAKYSVQKAINIHRKLNNRVEESASIINLGNIYLSESNYIKAKETYFEALELIKNNNGVVAIKYKANLYYNLAWTMRNLKDYKAYDFQELSYEIEGDIRDKEFRGIMDEINAEYNFETQKELLLKKEENKRLKDQTTFWIYGIGSFIVILTLLYGLNFYKLKQKNLGLKLSQTELIQNQNIEKIKSESQIRILNATIDGKETERKQIAETLHDSVSALLSSANLHLQASRTQFNGKTPLEIDKTQQIITEASQKIRDLSHTLVSSVLLKFGLNYAIKDLAEKYSNSQIKMNTEINGLRRYHQSFEIKAYNIIQEFLNNILKHSKAKNANIFIEEKDNNLCIEIKDDGIGFDKTKITEKDGLGINQIDARIHVMEGEFYIVSEIGRGTKIMVELPILEKETIIHV